MDVTEIAADLLAEQAVLDKIVGGLTDAQIGLATLSPRWTIADQIGHLTYFDRTAALAVTDPVEFQQAFTDLLTAAAEGDEGIDDFTIGEFRLQSSADQLEGWRSGRQVLSEAAATLTNDARVPWYGPAMGAKSFLTARLMETWAHGQDVVDTVRASRPATNRLRHIAQLGYITRKWTYLNRHMDVPEGDVRVELMAPSGDTWIWGESGDASVSGSAEDFCLVTTQRRNIADTGLLVEGPRAIDWMSRAQAFAGPPTDGPEPRRT